MRKVIALVWVVLLLGTLVTVPKGVKAEDTNWWVKTYGGEWDDYANAVALARNGDIIVAGYTKSFGAGYKDVWILRLDENGNVIWQKTYGGSKDDVANAVAIAPNGDIIVVGYTKSFGMGDADVWVLRLDENGNVKWQKTYGGSRSDWANAVIVDKNRNIIVAGWTRSFGAGDDDIWVLKLNSEGNVKWQKTYGGSNWDAASTVALTSTGDIVVAGSTASFGAGSADVWVLRLDANGNVKWQKTYGGIKLDGGLYGLISYLPTTVISVISDNDIIVASYTDSFGKGGIWLLRLDGNGNVKWQKTYGVHNDVPYAITVTPEGDIVVGGWGTNLNTWGSFWVFRLDANGNIEWQKIYGADPWNGAHAVALAPSGDIIVAGQIESFGAGGADIWVLRLPPDGNLPGCTFCRDSNAKVMDSNAQVSYSNAVVKESDAIVTDSNARVSTENPVVETQYPKFSTLRITSQPEGAKVYIDETYKGATPLTLELNPRTYKLKLTKEGYQDYEDTITLKAGETKELDIKLEPSLESLKIEVPNIVDTPFNLVAVPLVIKNPTDGEIEVPITVYGGDNVEVKISEDTDNLFKDTLKDRDSIKVTVGPHQTKVLAIEAGTEGYNGISLSLKIKVGSKVFHTALELNGKEFELGNNLQMNTRSLVTQKGYVNFDGVRIKVAPIEDLTIMTGYNPEVHGWGFANEDTKRYNPLLKSGLINILYAQMGIFGPVPPWDSLLLAESLSTYKAQQGLCYGMVYTSGLYYEGMLDIHPNPGKLLDPNDTITYKGKKISAENLIAAYFATQYLEAWLDIFGSIFGSEDFKNYYGKSRGKSQKEAFKLFSKCLSSGHVCDVSVNQGGVEGMHEVLAYGLIKLYNDKYVVLVYDPNYPFDTRFIYLNPSSQDDAKYLVKNGKSATIVRIRPILPVDPNEIIAKALGLNKDKILLYLDPVEAYTIKTSDGTILNNKDYLSVKGEGYEVVILPKGNYTIDVTGKDYILIGSVPSGNGGVLIYNITAKGEDSQDILTLRADKIEYHAGSFKEVSVNITYAGDNLSKISSISKNLALNKNQGVVISGIQQVSPNMLNIGVDKNGDGIPDEVISSSVKETTNTHKETNEISTSTASTKTNRSICGPSAILAISIMAIALLRKRQG
ncbi:PEGA domain-containing protein [Thermococcus sp.]